MNILKFYSIFNKFRKRLPEDKVEKLQDVMDEVFEKNREKILNEKVLDLYDKFYEESMNKIKDMNINLDDFYSIANNEEYIKNYGVIFSALLSAMINKISIDNPNKVIELNFNKPLNYLLARVNNVKVKVNKGGNSLAYGAENSQIYFKEAGNGIGTNMKNSILILEVAGDHIGHGGRGIKTHERYSNKIYIKKEAGDCVGCGMQSSYMVVNKSGNYLGASSYGSIIFANVTKKNAGYFMKKGELNVNMAGSFLGMYARNSVIRVKKFDGSRIGVGAKITNIYIYKMANITHKSIAVEFFKGPKNNLYLGEETYEKIIKIPEYQEYIDRIHIWDEKDYKEWESKMEAKLKELETIDIS